MLGLSNDISFVAFLPWEGGQNSKIVKSTSLPSRLFWAALYFDRENFLAFGTTIFENSSFLTYMDNMYIKWKLKTF